MTVKQGAEAKVSINDKEVQKERIKKEYRHPSLDQRIRKERNKSETRIMKKAYKNGVKTPKVMEKNEYAFKMSKINGETLKKALKQEPDLIKEFAEQISILHNADIIHGDLTTSNAIISRENGLYIIDFGLSYHSERTEDKAVDLHLAKQVINTSHTERKEQLWEKFKQTYTEKGNKDAIKKIEDIENRARYK